MELLELWQVLEALVYGCGCFLEMTAAGANVGAGVAGYKAHQARKTRREAMGKGDPPPGKNPALRAFIVLVIVGALLTALVAWKWLR
jgi:hypothetical protein